MSYFLGPKGAVVGRRTGFIAALCALGSLACSAPSGGPLATSTGADSMTGDSCPGTAPPWPETPSTSYPRLIDYSWMSVADWCQRHQELKTDSIRTSARVIFIGDSIMQGWSSRGPEVFRRHFGKYGGFNMGMGGDQTQHVLWRIEHHEFDGLDPDVVVLQMGLNSIGRGGFTEAQTAEGVSAVFEALTKMWPRAKMVEMGVFPAERDPNDKIRAKIGKTNELLEADAKRKGRIWVDLEKELLNPDGTISSDILYDYYHPTEKGYEIWAQKLDPLLASIRRP